MAGGKSNRLLFAIADAVVAWQEGPDPVSMRFQNGTGEL